MPVLLFFFILFTLFIPVGGVGRLLIILIIFTGVLHPEEGQPSLLYPGAETGYRGYGGWFDYSGKKSEGCGAWLQSGYGFMRYALEGRVFSQTEYDNNGGQTSRDVWKREGLVAVGPGGKNAGLMWGPVGRGHEWLAWYRNNLVEITLRYRYGDSKSRTISAGSRGELFFGFSYTVTGDESRDRYAGFYAGMVFGQKWQSRIYHLPNRQGRMDLFRFENDIESKQNKKTGHKKKPAPVSIRFSRKELLEKGIPVRYVVLFSGREFSRDEFFQLLKTLPKGARGKIYLLYREKYP